MRGHQLEVVAIDVFNCHEFLLHFSDDTYATVTAQALAECFPERTPNRPMEDSELSAATSNIAKR